MSKLIAITGGIGSGKSAVLRIISSLNYPVISADDVNRELLCDENYLAQLRMHFAEAFRGGQLDKKALANIIFTDKDRRLELNSIAHCEIHRIIEHKISLIMSSIIFVEVPLLIESGMIDMFDDIIVVTANREIKIERVMKRDNITRDEVISRMNSQLDDGALLDVATYVIENDSTFSVLETKVKDIIDQL